MIIDYMTVGKIRNIMVISYPILLQVPSALNYADMMSKPMGPQLLRKFVKGLRLCDSTDFPDVMIGSADLNGITFPYATDGYY